MNAPAVELKAPQRAVYEPSAVLGRLLRRVPEEIYASFSPKQLAALDAALESEYSKRHPLNLRVTFFGRVYLTILGGQEQRSPARRAEERKRHPLASPGNLVFLVVVAIVGLLVGNALHRLLFGG